MGVVYRITHTAHSERLIKLQQVYVKEQGQSMDLSADNFNKYFRKYGFWKTRSSEELKELHMKRLWRIERIEFEKNLWRIK